MALVLYCLTTILVRILMNVAFIQELEKNNIENIRQILPEIWNDKNVNILQIREQVGIMISESQHLL